MNSCEESKSLSEVREWKEQCYLEDKELIATAYLEKIRDVAKSVKLRYNIKLNKVIRQS